MVRPITRSARGPRPKNNWIGYVDCGKTNCRVGVMDKNGISVCPTLNYDVTLYRSVEQILDDAFRQFGGIPKRMVLALPGPINAKDRTVRLLDLDWPVFDLGRFEQRTDCKGVLVNDLQLQAAGCQYNLQNRMDPFQYFRLVKAGDSPFRNWKDGVWLDGRVVVATLTTGDNFSAYEDNGKPWGFEGGHFSIAGTTDEERSYCTFAEQFHAEAGGRAEMLIGGARAFNTAAEWLYAQGMKPSAEVGAAIAELQRTNKGIGPIITQYPDDPFCATIIRVVGGLMGTWLRGVMEITQPTGLMVLVGTIMVQAGHILTDPRRSPFVERLTQSVPYGDRLNEFTVVICDDLDMARKGAFVLANLMQ